MTDDQLIAALKIHDDFYVERRAPMTVSQLSATEAALGFALPHLLRRLYFEIGNGGFAP